MYINILPLAVTALLFTDSALAGPQFYRNDNHRRDDTANAGQAPSGSLEPVVPPDVNPDSLNVLKLSTSQTLSWAGSTGEDGAKRKRELNEFHKREGAVFASAEATFAYPAVPLDYSNLINKVQCSDSGKTISGSLTQKAYDFAKKYWAGQPNIVFLTAADGCGPENNNDLFLAKKLTFLDSSKTFVATGSHVVYGNVTKKMELKWGPPGVHDFKRSVNKRSLFEPLTLEKRARLDFTIPLGVWAHNILGHDLDAPWPNAALLKEWSKEGGKKEKPGEEKWKKGEVAKDGRNKRAIKKLDYNGTETETTGLAIRNPEGNSLVVREGNKWEKETSKKYGLKVWCVDCGFGGSVTMYGEITIDWDFDYLIPLPSVGKVRTGFEAEFHAGLYVGAQAFVTYEKSAKKELGKIPLGGWDIFELAEVGPFLKIEIEAKAGVEATGSLLIGAGVRWDNIDVMLDLKDSKQSYSRGWTPQYEHRAEATGELKVYAGLGLPITLGVGISVLGDLLSAEAGITDTPSIVAEGKFEVSASVTKEGTIEYDINGGCYGIAWDVHFENSLAAKIEAFGEEWEWPLMPDWESDPIAEGCIRFVKGGDDDDDSPLGIGTAGGATGNGANGGGSGMSGGEGLDPDEDEDEVDPPAPSTTSTTTVPGGSAPNPTTTTKSTTTTKKPTSTTKLPPCTATPMANPSPPKGTVCKRTLNTVEVYSKFNVGKKAEVKSVKECAQACLRHKDCMSWSFNSRKECQLYNKGSNSLGMTNKKGKAAKWEFNDKACWQYSKCPK